MNFCCLGCGGGARSIYFGDLAFKIGRGPKILKFYCFICLWEDRTRVQKENFNLMCMCLHFNNYERQLVGTVLSLNSAATYSSFLSLLHTWVVWPCAYNIITALLRSFSYTTVSAIVPKPETHCEDSKNQYLWKF